MLCHEKETKDRGYTGNSSLSLSPRATPSALTFVAPHRRFFPGQLRAEKESFALLESLDCGKPLRESRADMDACADLLVYYADLAVSRLVPVRPQPAFLLFLLNKIFPSRFCA